MNAVDFSNVFVIVFLAGTAFQFVLEQFLEFQNWRARRKDGADVPALLSDVPAAASLNKEKRAEIAAYKNARYASWIPSSAVSFAVSLALVCTGFYPWIFNIVCRATGIPSGFGSLFACALLFFVLASLPESLLSLPFELYQEFVVERRFGFSKMTLRLWILDELKSLAVSLVMSAALLAAMSAVLTLLPNQWWIVLAAVFFAVTLGVQALYPLVVAPLFNTFTPLADGALKDAISALMERNGFRISGIFVMDASKRSRHSNAYFGGLGKSKRIVLYDTLVEQLSADELAAVLGHELGHCKLHHILRRVCVMLPAEFLLMFLLYWCARIPSLYTGFGFAVAPEMVEPLQFLGVFLASLVAAPLGTVFAPLVNFFSRRDEYAADRFSARASGMPEALVSGLVKLNIENLSDVQPSPLYVFWNYSHPTLLERIAALKRLAAEPADSAVRK
ncbi:MAG: M48 family metallopeptidase [Treponemataceae bacterium]|nr:M48 family metallopeptidase [Treponemataceae bacterium]